MGRTAYTEDETDAIRTRMIEDALALYQNQGIRGLTLRGLAICTGVSSALPYRYFKNKDELVSEMRITCLRRFFVAIVQANPTRGDPIDRIRLVAQEVLRFGEANPAQYSLIFTLPQPPLARFPKLLAFRQEVFNYTVGVVEDAVTAKAIDVPPRTFAHLMWSILHGMLSLHVAGQFVHGMRLKDLAGPAVEAALRSGQPPSHPQSNIPVESRLTGTAAVPGSPRPVHQGITKNIRRQP